MKTLAAIEQNIKELKERLDRSRKNLSKHESGQIKLTRLQIVTIENTMEEAQAALDKYEIMKKEIEENGTEKELEEAAKLAEAVKRQTYFKYQKDRLQKKIENDDDWYVVLNILEEIEGKTQIEDEFILEIKENIKTLNLTNIQNVDQKYIEIKNDFTTALSRIQNENIKSIGGLDSEIPIFTTQLHFLVADMKEKNPNFKGLPKYQDWWIKELWYSHQSYFALYRWKEIINAQCANNSQKKIWNKLFTTWLNIKRKIRLKSKQGYEYHNCFDKIVEKYCELEEELEKTNLESMEKIVKMITQREDFTNLRPGHSTQTSYLKFKQDKVQK